MSAIIRNLPIELIRIIREYVFDLDTKVDMLLLIISEIEPGANILTLFRKFTTKQLQTISDDCRNKIFNQNTRAFTPSMEMIMPPPITYRRGHSPYDWAPAYFANNPYTDHSVQHPIINQLANWSLSKHFGIQKTKRAKALVEYVNFLIYTKVSYVPFDNTIRRMAYNVLAGSLILYNEIQRTPLKENPWRIKYMEQRAAEAAAMASTSTNV